MAGRIAHMDLVDAEISRETRKRPRGELFALLNRGGAICGAVRTLREVMADPLLHESGLLQEIDHPEYGRLVVARSALRFSGAAAPAYEPSHALGADNAAVFGAELGLTDDELEGLRKAGVI